MKVIISFYLFLHFFTTNAQQDFPFVSGEKITYSAYYNWHFIWIRSGEVNFYFTDSVSNNENIWRFSADGNTLKVYDLLYKVRDTFNSECVAETFAPVFFNREVNHGSKYTSHTYQVNHPSQKIYSSIKRSKQPFFRDTIPYQEGVYDLLATSYYARALDYNNYKVGHKIEIDLIVDNEIHPSYFKSLGKEVIDVKGCGTFLCHKISVFLLESDFFPEGEYMKVWITDDVNRLPVMVETKITVGSVKAILQSYEGIKGKMNSKIKN